MLVFISHSTKSDSPSDKEYLDALEASLGKKFTVLLDRTSIEGSQEGSCEIDLYMRRCHAAIILFSRNALKSEWVAKEAAILNWRRSLDPKFLLLPVTLEGVSPEEVRENKRFAVMGLGRWQFITPGPPTQVADNILTLCSKHAPPPSSTPLDRLVIKLTGIMESAPRAALENAAQTLGIPVPQWDTRDPQALAEALAHRLVQGGLHEMHPLIRILGPPLYKMKANRLFECIKPLWVDAEAAGKIPPTASNQDERWAIGLNGKKLFDFTARHYLNRAYWNDPTIQLIPVDAAVGQRAFEDIQWQIEQYLTDKGIDPNEQEYHHENTANTFFVLLPPPVPEPDTLERLQARFPRMTFLITTGEEGHDDPRIKNHRRLLTLEPALKTQVEQAARQLHRDLKMLIDRIEE